jgi:SAM-dependent methyltransferase
MPETIQFNKVADLYDYYVNVDFDIDFFVQEAKKAKGRVLELTSGTGRVSIPLLKKGIDLTCIDYSRKMLSILKKKLEKNKLKCPVFNMDITQFKLKNKYDLIFIPFHSFSEIVEKVKHKKALEGIYSHLTDKGNFICTLHNPEIRLKSIDGTIRYMGKYPMANDKSLFMQYVMSYNPDTQIVSGQQFYEIYDDKNKLIDKRYLDIRFYLFNKQEFEDLVRSVGFQVVELYGDYSYSKFEEDKSPFMIWKLRK